MYKSKFTNETIVLFNTLSTYYLLLLTVFTEFYFILVSDGTLSYLLSGTGNEYKFESQSEILNNKIVVYSEIFYTGNDRPWIGPG